MAETLISTATRLTYARGYLGLGMVREAFHELNAIVREDRRSPEVRKVRVEWGMAAGSWKQVVTWARPLTEEEPAYEPAWIALAYALRELNEVEEAKRVLMLALPHHQTTSGVLHYNLACYECLLGNHEEARRRLSRAVKMDPGWKEAAKGDPDLKGLNEARA